MLLNHHSLDAKNKEGISSYASAPVFLWLWNTVIQGWDVPLIHSQMLKFWCTTMQQGTTTFSILAFRGSGKSTLCAVFLAYLLYRYRDLRILVVAAEQSLANKMVSHVRHIIERHPLTLDLKNSRGIWREDAFFIKRTTVLRDPSMLARGIHGNVTGCRADIIVCDDVEVPATTSNIKAQNKLISRIDELRFVLTPNGHTLFLGTPHHQDSIYFGKLKHHPSLSIPVIVGDAHTSKQSAWPELFNYEKITHLRAEQGEQLFFAQMMLQPQHYRGIMVDTDAIKTYNKEIVFRGTGIRPSLGGEVFLSRAVAFWDPAMGGINGDSSMLALVFTDDNKNQWLHRVITIDGGDGTINQGAYQCRQVLAVLQRYRIGLIDIEANGVGSFLPSQLRDIIKTHPSHFITVRAIHHHKAKKQRINHHLLGPLARGTLMVHTQVMHGRFGKELMALGPHNTYGDGHDDALDAAAGALAAIGAPMMVRQKMIRHRTRGGAFSRSTFPQSSRGMRSPFNIS